MADPPPAPVYYRLGPLRDAGTPRFMGAWSSGRVGWSPWSRHLPRTLPVCSVCKATCGLPYYACMYCAAFDMCAACDARLDELAVSDPARATREIHTIFHDFKKVTMLRQ